MRNCLTLLPWMSFKPARRTNENLFAPADTVPPGNTLEWPCGDSSSIEEICQLSGRLWLVFLTGPLGHEKLGNP